MARHDLILETVGVGGTPFGADASAGLQAIATTFDGTGWPTTTYPNQVAINSTTNQIGRRNRANNDWIIIGDYDGGEQTFRSPGTVNKFDISDIVATRSVLGLFPIDHYRGYGAGTLHGAPSNDTWFPLSQGNSAVNEDTDTDVYTTANGNTATTTITRNGRYRLRAQANMNATSDANAAFAIRAVIDGVGTSAINARSQRPPIPLAIPIRITTADVTPVVIEFQYKGIVASGNFQMSNGHIWIECVEFT